MKGTEVVGPTNCKRNWTGLEPRRGSARTTSLTLLWFGPPLFISLNLIFDSDQHTNFPGFGRF